MVSMVNNLVVLDYGTQFDVEFAKYDPYMHSMASQQTNFYWYNNLSKEVTE